MTVFLVVTHGKGSMDLYSSRLSRYLPVPIIHTRVYEEVFERFNSSLLSPSTLLEFHAASALARRLNKVEGVLHLPNHHFGRVCVMLRRPFIITVHDLIRYFDALGYGPLIHRPNLKDKLWIRLDYEGARRAARIIAPSNKTKQDLVKFLGVPEEKVRVIYHGVDEVFRPSPGWRPCEEPYILYVGSEHPRKNLTTLLMAFKELKDEYPELRGLKLVKAGRVGGGEAEFRKETLRVVQDLGLLDDVVFLDWVPQERLACLYSEAEVFAFPSLYEGFGWPPLEAMACGCPVISSNAASMPEILGDAAIYAAPKDMKAWREALAAVLTDSGLRRKLSQRGVERAALFTWRRAAEETLKVYREVEEEVGLGGVEEELTAAAALALLTH